MRLFCRWVFVGLGCLLAGGCGPLVFTVGATPGQDLTSTTVLSDGGWGNDRIALIDVTGLIINANQRSILSEGENPVGFLDEKLQRARHDPRVKAVLLRLNTPGGTVTASDAMYSQVIRFRQETGKPVVVLMLDVAASGGYYLACAADTIVAHPTTVTGSIGVIVQTVSFKPALNRIGIETEALTSGPNKDAGSPLSTLTDEHRAVLRALVDDFYQRFVQIVRERRPNIPADRFAAVTDGRVLTGNDALDAGLVDQLGDLHAAFEVAKKQAGLTGADLVLYHRPGYYAGSPYATAAAPPGNAGSVQINLAQINVSDALVAASGASAGFYYLWQPQLP